MQRSGSGMIPRYPNLHVILDPDPTLNRVQGMDVQIICVIVLQQAF
jgi:hypothetical protein